MAIRITTYRFHIKTTKVKILLVCKEMFCSVPAVSIHLSPVIMGCIFVSFHNEIFIFKAQAALVSGWVECTASSDHFQRDVVVLVVALHSLFVSINLRIMKWQYIEMYQQAVYYMKLTESSIPCQKGLHKFYK